MSTSAKTKVVISLAADASPGLRLDDHGRPGAELIPGHTLVVPMPDKGRPYLHLPDGFVGPVTGLSIWDNRYGDLDASLQRSSQ